MGLPGIGAQVRASNNFGGGHSFWNLEWTFTDASGAVLLDDAQSDRDPRVATPVADAGTGLVTVRFPKSRHARVVHCGIIASATTTGDARTCEVASLDAAAGSCTFRIRDYAGALADPAVSARARLLLDLDYQ